MNDFHFGPITGQTYVNEVKGEAEAYNARRVGYERDSHDHKNGFIKKCADKDKDDAKRNNTHHEPMKTAQDYKDRQKHADKVKRNADNINGYRAVERINKKYGSYKKAANEEVEDMNEFHFGPMFESNLKDKTKSIVNNDRARDRMVNSRRSDGSSESLPSHDKHDKDHREIASGNENINIKRYNKGQRHNSAVTKTVGVEKEDFHFGPMFGDDYLNEAKYNGKAIEYDRDPMDPSLDEIVNSGDNGDDYGFSPLFNRESIFHTESKKRYRS